MEISNSDLQELGFDETVAIEGGGRYDWIKYLFDAATYVDAANDFVNGWQEGWNAPRG